MADAQTEKLRQHALDQIDRLMQELQDLEEYRADMTDDEYESGRQDALEQLKEFEHALGAVSDGSIGLLGETDAVRLALRAAISSAFRTPEVIALFARRQPAQLRMKLENLERDFKMHKLDSTVYQVQKAEILVALEKLGETLSEVESAFLTQHGSSTVALLVNSESDSTARVEDYVAERLVK